MGRTADGRHDSRQVLENYYEKLEFTLSLHHMTLVTRSRYAWVAINPVGSASTFWAAHTIRALVEAYYEEASNTGPNDTSIIRTGLGLHAAIGSPGSSDPATLLAGTALPFTERLADFSAFLRVGPVVSADLAHKLAPGLLSTLRKLGPWKLIAGGNGSDLYALGGAPNPPGQVEGTDALEAWDAALSARQARDWSSALVALRAFLLAHPGDRLARWHLKQALRQLEGERPRIPGTSR